MGSLVQMPLSEITSTLEILSNLGVTPQEFDKLRSRDMSSRVRMQIVNLIKHNEDACQDLDKVHIIDGDAEPPTREGYEVVYHSKCGKIDLKDIFPLSLDLEELKLKEVAQENRAVLLNANVYDYLYQRPWLIPGNWGKRTLVFAGTQYRRVGHPKEGYDVFALQWFPGGRNYVGSAENIPNANWRVLTRDEDETLYRDGDVLMCSPIEDP